MKLLLIDDDEVDRMVIVRALNRSSLVSEITQAPSGKKGLQLASQFTYDAILLDYRLPDMDGIDILLELRRDVFVRMPVVIISQMEDDAISEKCLESGAQDFLLKSEVTANRLARVIKQAKLRFDMESALLHSHDLLRKLSEHDPLTGLLNRRGLEVNLDIAISRSKRGSDQLALLLLDLDDFKSVNDTLGHEFGDILLKELSERLKTTIRDSDYLCRLGGDEFVILMTDFDFDNQSALLANRIVDALQVPFDLGRESLIMTASIGIAIYGKETKDASNLLRHADLAMYQAKQDGRNCSRFYSDILNTAIKQRHELKNSLQNALMKNEFEIFYQAQVDANTNEINGIEALLRWNHPSRGLLIPSEFLDIAEEFGLIVPIGLWVFKDVFKTFSTWQNKYALPEQLRVAVNLSSVQIKSENFLINLIDILNVNHFDPLKLALEITEGSLIKDTHAALQLLDSLEKMGIHFSLDDFGTGFSSLTHLKLFPVHTLKIDRSFTAMIGQNVKDEKLLMAMIAFAKSLDMTVVAEGVESKEQATFYRENHCDLLQGFYFSNPSTAKIFEDQFLKVFNKNLAYKT